MFSISAGKGTKQKTPRTISYERGLCHDDIALLANASAEAGTMLHSLEQAAGSIGLHVNADKTENMCFNQRGDIFSLDGSSLKIVESLIGYRS